MGVLPVIPVISFKQRKIKHKERSAMSNKNKVEAIGLSLSVYIILYLLTSFVLSALSDAIYTVLSLLFKIVRFGVPVLVYAKLTGYKPDLKAVKPKGGTLLEFAFAVSFVVTAVNVVGTVTDKLFSLIGINNVQGQIPRDAGALITMFLGSVLLAAVAEEILFRGAVMDALNGFGDKTKIFLSALLFALMHCNLLQIPYSFVAGAIISAFSVRTGSLLYAIAIHFTANAVTYAFTLVRVFSSKKTAEFASDIAFLVFALASLAGIAYFVIKRKKSEANEPKFTLKQFFTAGTAIYLSFTLLLSILSIT